MHKCVIFIEKNCKNHPALGIPPPDPLASGGWKHYPQTPGAWGLPLPHPTNPLTEKSWLRY